MTSSLNAKACSKGKGGGVWSTEASAFSIGCGQAKQYVAKICVKCLADCPSDDDHQNPRSPKNSQSSSDSPAGLPSTNDQGLYCSLCTRLLST